MKPRGMDSRLSQRARCLNVVHVGLDNCPSLTEAEKDALVRKVRAIPTQGYDEPEKFFARRNQ
jgi:hypothetical protein